MNGSTYCELLSIIVLFYVCGMYDVWLQSGVPRCGYRGIVSIMVSGRRVYLSPPSGWRGYDTTWK